MQRCVLKTCKHYDDRDRLGSGHDWAPVTLTVMKPSIYWDLDSVISLNINVYIMSCASIGPIWLGIIAQEFLSPPPQKTSQVTSCAKNIFLILNPWFSMHFRCKPNFDRSQYFLQTWNSNSEIYLNINFVKPFTSFPKSVGVVGGKFVLPVRKSKRQFQPLC